MTQATDASVASTPSLTPAVVSAVALVLTLAVTFSGTGSQTVWYLIRVSGIVAYLLIVVTVVGGLLTTGRLLPPGRPRVDLFQVHSFTALLVIGFGLFHALALLLDTYVGFTPMAVFVPFVSTYKTLAVALGILTLYLVGVLYGSFWLRGLIGKGAWRVLHYTSFLAFVLATYHGIFTGSDSRTPAMIGVYFASFVVIAALLMYRVVRATSIAEDATVPGVTDVPAASSGGHLIAGVRR